jgi:uncharacterized membrane protein
MARHSLTRGFGRGAHLNVSEKERSASALLGGALVAFGMRRGLRGGAPAALVGSALLHRGLTGHCYAYQALGMNTRRRDRGESATLPRPISRSITIGRSEAELRAFIRDGGNLARVLSEFAGVEETPQGYRFELRLPERAHDFLPERGERALTWEARLVEDAPSALGFRSSPESEHAHELSFRFRPAPGGWGTEVTLELLLDTGAVAQTAIRALSFVPENALERALRRLKSLVETGEAPSTERNPTARRSRRLAPSSAAS